MLVNSIWFTFSQLQHTSTAKISLLIESFVLSDSFIHSPGEWIGSFIPSFRYICFVLFYFILFRIILIVLLLFFYSSSSFSFFLSVFRCNGTTTKIHNQEEPETCNSLSFHFIFHKYLSLLS